MLSLRKSTCIITFHVNVSIFRIYCDPTVWLSQLLSDNPFFTNKGIVSLRSKEALISNWSPFCINITKSCPRVLKSIEQFLCKLLLSLTEAPSASSTRKLFPLQFSFVGKKQIPLFLLLRRSDNSIYSNLCGLHHCYRQQSKCSLRCNTIFLLLNSPSKISGWSIAFPKMN